MDYRLILIVNDDDMGGLDIPIFVINSTVKKRQLFSSIPYVGYEPTGVIIGNHLVVESEGKKNF